MRKEQYDYKSKEYDKAAIVEQEAILKLLALGFSDMVQHDRLAAENADELCVYVGVMEHEASQYEYLVKQYKDKYGEDE